MEAAAQLAAPRFSIPEPATRIQGRIKSAAPSHGLLIITPATSG
jgi:hypothetical protein